jgi:hypothetical protein
VVWLEDNVEDVAAAVIELGAAVDPDSRPGVTLLAMAIFRTGTRESDRRHPIAESVHLAWR